MQKLTFLELAAKVLKEENKALTPRQIWEIVLNKNYQNLLDSVGKTPSHTMGAQLYVSVKKDNSDFKTIGDRPKRFTLMSNPVNTIIEESAEEEKTASEFDEKDLYPKVATYCRSIQGIYTKTISHNISRKNEYGEWLHPDLMGCLFPIGEYDNVVFDFSSKIGGLPIKVFSYEVKKYLNFSNIRQSFFQAVSNSSWAHEGYLVAVDISEDKEFLDELERLSAAFGIGIIQLNNDTIEESKVLFTAKSKDTLDYETINKMVKINPDIKAFFDAINKAISTKDINETKFDKTL